MQSLLWLPLLALVGISPFSEHLAQARIWTYGLLLALAAMSYLQIGRILGAGRTIADYVTIARFAGLWLGSFLALVLGQSGWGIWLLLLACVAADLLDGWCARRFGATPEGAVLDMETDQFAVLLLSLLAHHQVAWVSFVDLEQDESVVPALMAAAFLLLPACKYVFMLVMRNTPRFHDPKPRDGDNGLGRAICAVTLISLLALTAPLWPGELVLVRCSWAAAVALLLIWSFSRDGCFLRGRGGVSGAESGG